MNTTTIIELAQDGGSQTGEFTVTLPKPVTVREGDSIVMKNAFIDTGVLSDTSIVIAEDTDITLKFGIYEYNYDVAKKLPPFFQQGPAVAQRNLSVDGKMKVMRRIVTLSTFADEIVKINKTGSPNYATESPYFSVMVARTDMQPNPLKVQYCVVDSNILGPLTAQWSSGNTLVSSGGVQYQKVWTGSVFFQNLVGYPDQVYSVNNMGVAVPALGPKALLVSKEETVDEPDGPYFAGDIVEMTETITIKKGKYPPDALAKLITDGFNSRTNSTPFAFDCGPGNNLLVNLRSLAYSGKADFKDAKGNPTSRFNGCWSFLFSDPNSSFLNSGSLGYYYAIADDVDDATSNNIPMSLGWAPPDVMVGASQFGMSYQPGGYFQIDYMHTPFFDPTSKDISIYDFVVVDYSNATQTAGNPTPPVISNIILGKSSGIFLTDVQPRPFWSDTLGFNLDNLLVNINRTNPANVTVSSAEIEAKTPGGYQSLQSTMAASSRFVTPSTALNNGQYTQTEATHPIVGGVQTVNTTGYYLVELTGAHNSDYISSTGTFSHIIGVVSTQWNNGDFVTAYEDSAIPYVHRGMPLTLSKCTIRILDPLTKLPVASLGGGSTIVLEVSNQIQPTDVPTVPQPKKKNRKKRG
jgi:hypothetical protein